MMSPAPPPLVAHSLRPSTGAAAATGDPLAPFAFVSKGNGDILFVPHLTLANCRCAVRSGRRNGGRGVRDISGVLTASRRVSDAVGGGRGGYVLELHFCGDSLWAVLPHCCFAVRERFFKDSPASVPEAR